MSHEKRSRILLWLMLALCLLPVLASSALYFGRVPAGGGSYGVLLPTRPFPAAASPAWPKGRWVLAGVVSSPCDGACRQRQFTLRQIRAAQGEAAARLSRAALMAAAGPAPEAGVAVLPAPRSGVRGDGFYLVDPLGNQVLFYADDQEPRRIIQEVARVLKTNNGLG